MGTFSFDTNFRDDNEHTIMEQLLKRREEQMPWGRSLVPSTGPGPKAPDLVNHDTERLLKRMRGVDKGQSKRYLQRTGE